MSNSKPVQGFWASVIGFCLDYKFIVFLLVLLAAGWGAVVSPFDWQSSWWPRDPVPVDAIPDLGENQQIIFTEWPGRSPRDLDDQVTYPLTSALMGLPHVRTVRSLSFFGFSTIYILFDEDTDFYESRSRILEKLSSLPSGTLPPDVKPALGPDATGLGQVFWYTLEGRDEDGQPVGGWDLAELRKIQDFQVRDALLGVAGVAEVASVGGFEQEYQVEVDPQALLVHGITLEQVTRAVGNSNLDVGARSLEINRVEYVVRGVGTIQTVSDIEAAVVSVQDNVPVLVSDVATVSLGAALRRGVLDKEGAEAVGAVVAVRYGENPLAVIQAVKEQIKLIAPSLPTKILPDGRLSRITVVPFYDRSGLILETLDTLREALSLEILLTVVVVLIMVSRMRAGLLVAGLLPLAVLMTFIAMKVFKVDANIVALSGIAIAIGTMVDMGVVLVESILRRREEMPEADLRLVVHQAGSEVAGAVVTAVATTLIGFLPVFTLVAAEGKLFRPLAFTKTFALLASVIVAVTVIPPVAQLILGRRRVPPSGEVVWWRKPLIRNLLAALLAVILLARLWMPLGPERGTLLNGIFVIVPVGFVLLLFHFFHRQYPVLLNWCLRNKAIFLILPVLAMVGGGLVWKGLGREFMPPLDEGSFLYMPTTMPHASIGEAGEVLAHLDRAIASIPEVEQVVGKIGRARTALDPAPVSMVETVINYKSEYKRNENGHRQRFAYDRKSRSFLRDGFGELIPDNGGRFFRQWRPEIRSADDIWDEIVRVTRLTGTTSAPKLQPIGTRLVMLQSGMRAPMGVKVTGPTLEAIEAGALAIEKALKDVPEIQANTVIADRMVGKPYLELIIDRRAIARHGLSVAAVQNVIQTAVGGKTVTTTVEGRARHAVRVRYARERRDDPDNIAAILVQGADGVSVPLGDLVEMTYVRGPMTIKSENSFLLGYVIFDRQGRLPEVEVVEAARSHLDQMRDKGRLNLPPGVSYKFAGSFENQVRSEKTLRLVLPVALMLIFMVLYLQFRSLVTTAMVFAGVFVAWAGGFMMIWIYGQPWFLDFSLFGVHLGSLFHVHEMNLSVAVWVGFLALFGIATDDGVLMATYLEQSFRGVDPKGRAEVRRLVIQGASRRVRPALMTSATTILALLPILTLTGRGADIMVPMAIPSLGGMMMALLTLFIVPVLYAWRLERSLG